MKEKIRMNYAFKVIIRNKEYDVFNIEGKEHEGYNDIPKTWWLYYTDSLPQGFMPPHDSEHFIPYAAGIERLLWDIRFTQNTSSKIKWNEHQFSSNTTCEMWCNGKLVYSFGTSGGSRGMSFAMAKAQYLQTILLEHPFNFLDPEKENGRKIWWYGLPATIQNKSDKWEITVVPDYSTGVTKEEWWNEFKVRRSNINETKSSDDDISMWDDEDEGQNINWGDALSDQHINWFRN